MSSAESAARRKPPEQRRAEIIETAATIAVAEGLEKVTARRVADVLGVVPGLVNHYFRSADDLVAAAFAHAAGGESEQVFGHAEAAVTAPERIQRLVGDWLDADQDSISLLWLDAWQAGRRRPALLAAVTVQMNSDLARLEDLIRGGVENGELQVADAAAAALQIMALVDATSIHAAVRRTGIDYSPIYDMAVTTIEDTLGLAAGALRR